MRWPWQREIRQAGGSYTAQIVAAIEAHAASTAADSASTAATESVAGLLSRTLAAAQVDAPSWVQDAVTPSWLGLQGRVLVREGAALSAIVLRDGGASVALLPSRHMEF